MRTIAQMCGNVCLDKYTGRLIVFFCRAPFAVEVGLCTSVRLVGNASAMRVCACVPKAVLCGNVDPSAKAHKGVSCMGT